MRILFISYFFPPDKAVGGHRASSITKVFVEEGINIALLTANQEISELEELKNYHNLSDIYQAKESQIRKIGYKTKILVGLELFNLDRLLFFPDLYFPWIRRALKVGEKALKELEIDAIMVTLPPYSAAVVGYKLSKKYDIPLIVDHRDPWTSNPTFTLPRFIVRKRHRKLESKITRHARINVAVGNECAQLLGDSSGVEKETFHIIPNGYFESNVPDKEVPKIEDKFTISYFGNYYKVHKPYFSEFVMGLKEMIDKNNLNPEQLAIRYAGLTSRTAIHRDLARGDLLPYFEDLGHLEGKTLIEEIQKSHLNFVFVPSSVEYALATKIYDYAVGNSHILIIGGKGEISDWCDVIEQKYSLVEGKADSITKVLDNLFKKWKNTELEYGCNKTKLTEYGRFNLAIKYANIVKKELK